MEFNVPKTNFVLSTRDISTSTAVGDYPLSNSIGSFNSTRTVVTWNAVNIKNILGELYDKYELFNIELVGFSNPAFGASQTVTDNDRNCIYYMSGLSWNYNNYDTDSLHTTSEAIIGAVRIPVSIFNINLRSMTTTFRKTQTADITITIRTVFGTLPNLAGDSLFPFINYEFVITPVS